MTQYRLLLATLLAAFALTACSSEEPEVVAEPAAPTADQAAPAPSGEQSAPPAMEQTAPPAGDQMQQAPATGQEAPPPANN